MSKEQWTTEDIPDLSGKVIIVTGGNVGLGYESVKAFAEKGATTILASRSIERGETAKAEIEKGNTSGTIEVMKLDLADLEGIKGFVEEFKSRFDRLDVLLNNAGIMMSPYFKTKDGFEAQMGINHLGHFALTGQLLDLIKKTPGSRVVNVSSGAHKSGSMDFNNLLFEGGSGYAPMRAYGRSKLANLLFTYELQRRFENHNLDAISVASHPGFSRTDLARYMVKKFYVRLLFPLSHLFSQSAAMGALTQIRAAVDPGVRGGDYYGPKKGRSEMAGYPQLVESNAASHNKEDAQRLWEVSEKLTGICYQF